MTAIQTQILTIVNAALYVPLSYTTKQRGGVLILSQLCCSMLSQNW